MHFTIFLVFSLHWEGQNELELANFRDVRAAGMGQNRSEAEKTFIEWT